MSNFAELRESSDSQGFSEEELRLISAGVKFLCPLSASSIAL